MRTSRHSSGFTLIEILVTVVIIGIVLSIAVLSLNIASDDREIRREAQRLMSIMQAVQDDAILQGRDFGIEFLQSSYRFVEYDAISGQWFEVVNDDLLRTRNLPEDFAMDLFLEDKEVLLDESPLELAFDEDDDVGTDVLNYVPHVFIFSSGDMTPFELHFTRETDRLMVPIQGDLLGNLEFQSDDEDVY